MTRYYSSKERKEAKNVEEKEKENTSMYASAIYSTVTISFFIYLFVFLFTVRCKKIISEVNERKEEKRALDEETLFRTKSCSFTRN